MNKLETDTLALVTRVDYGTLSTRELVKRLRELATRAHLYVPDPAFPNNPERME